jgi:transcriptional regulator GlxA family with amidase domain
VRLTFLLYKGVEPIDLAAIGVVSMARRVIPEVAYRTVAASLDPVEMSNGLRVLPDITYDECTSADVLMVPGGPGWPEASQDARTLSFIQRMAPQATVCSVCTGAMILAAAGTLDGREATTKKEVVPPEVSPLQELQRRYPAVRAVSALVVDTGTVITGGGVSLCIDAVLHLLSSRYGAEAAGEVARIIEYSHAHAANKQRLPLLDSRA